MTRAGEYKLSSVHVHSKRCDGKNTLDELAVTAWKAGLKTLGFTGHSHTPDTPVMVGASAKAQQFSQRMLEEGVFALAIVFPTVPRGKERLRTIVTAGHELKDLEFAAAKFAKVGKEMGIIK